MKESLEVQDKEMILNDLLISSGLKWKHLQVYKVSKIALKFEQPSVMSGKYPLE